MKCSCLGETTGLREIEDRKLRNTVAGTHRSRALRTVISDEELHFHSMNPRLALACLS